LALAAAQHGNSAMQQMLDSEFPAERLCRFRIARTVFHIPPYVEMRKQVAVLRDERSATTFGWLSCDIFATDAHASSKRTYSAGNYVQQRALAGRCGPRNDRMAAVGNE
jgi:hypothetical protein